MIYAQAEDDFNRIERNYLIGLGWLAQAEGESALYSDLRARLFIDVGRLQQQYRGSPPWLKSLMDAWADGLNYFLSKHPAVHAKVIQHFEPWMALSFTEGSIGGDIETIDLKQLAKILRAVHAAHGALERGIRSGCRGVSGRLEWLRHRPKIDGVRTRDALDQSAHLLLFSLANCRW